MLLVDTSVWVDHFRRGNARLVAALQEQRVVTHPFVIGELACGEIRDRGQVMAGLQRLPVAPVATDAEALSLIESRRLMGRRLGYLDVHLLAATLLSPQLRLWTLDIPLSETATRLGIGPSATG